jgi:hypothetical protein
MEYTLKINYMLQTRISFILMLSFFALTGCSSNEIGDSKDVSQDKIYQSYTINYAEGNSNAEIYCQFRFAGKNGTTLVLNEPSQVQFDGTKIKVDSSETGGAYYRVYKPADNFFGKHSFDFTTTADKKLENGFSFDHFKLANVPASISKRQDLNLGFEATALRDEDYIEVNSIGSDSSFSVTHSATDKGNFISIPAKELKRQKVKEISLEAILHRNIPLQQVTAEGGKMKLSYALKPVKIKLAE